MDHTECCVTVLHWIYDNADSEQVIHLIQCLVLIHHLLINTEEMFYTSVYFRFNISILHMLWYFCNDLLHKFFTLCLACIQIMHQLIINFRLVIFQRKIIKFCLDLGNTETLGDWSVDIHRLSWFLFLLRRCHKLHRTHIMQTVCKFYNDDTDIFRHGKKHLAQILSLHLKPVRILVLRILGAVCQMQVL